MDGLIHISELSWSHVNHPSEVLEIGQTVKVKVLDIDRERQRISLGLKQTQSDPWQQVLDNYREGDVVEGRVAKVVTFGAFVEILPGVEGLVHISELAAHHVENPREVVAQGQAVNVRILEIDGDRRRLSLSLKRVEEGEQPVPRADGAESVHTTPELVLSEEAFPASSAAETAEELAEEVEGGEPVEEAEGAEETESDDSQAVSEIADASPEAGPAEAGPAEAGPAEAGPAEAGLSEAEPSEAGPSEAEPSEAEPAETAQAEVEPEDSAAAEAAPDEPDAAA